MKVSKILISTAVIIIVGGGVYLVNQYYTKAATARQERLQYEVRKNAWQGLQQCVMFELSNFKGEVGVVLKDIETGWEISNDRAKLFPSASLPKIPIMAACFLAADKGKIKLSNNILLKSSDKLTGSGALKNMPSGTNFSVERLIGLMIYDSDNTATNIITNLVGIDYLNKTFKTFGLKNTELSRKIADYRSRDKGVENYTTAEDVALLLEKIYRRELGNKYVSDQCIRILKLTRTNDRIPKYLPVEITVAHKTGLERDVCHDAGIVFTQKGDYIIVVLTKHSNSNSNSSKELISRIALHMYKYFEGL